MTKLFSIVVAVALVGSPAAHAAVHIEGRVEIAGAPVAGSKVTLWSAGAGAPTSIGEASTGVNGGFVIDAAQTPADPDYYLVAKGGTPAVSAARADPTVALLSVLGASPPEKVVVNEMTTVASAMTSARFMNGEQISGPPLGLKIAAGNAPNFVDPRTGQWGEVILDPLNSGHTTTLATLDTLGSLITAYGTVGSDDWRARFLKAATAPGGATPRNTLEAMAGIARAPWAAPKDLYSLFDEAYPQPKNPLDRRGAPFAPYLAYVPPTSRCHSISPGAASPGPASSCSMPMAICGAARTSCPAHSPA
jgi:hypothetical protein